MDARSYETVFTNAKAGMGEVDRERVKRVVFEASKVGAQTCMDALLSSRQRGAARSCI